MSAQSPHAPSKPSIDVDCLHLPCYRHRQKEQESMRSGTGGGLGPGVTHSLGPSPWHCRITVEVPLISNVMFLT